MHFDKRVPLASTYRNQGLWEHAAKLQQNVVHHATKNRGPKDSVRVDAMSNLAISYFELRRFNKAEKLVTKA